MLLCLYAPQQRAAAHVHVAPGCLEITGVPRVGDASGTAREVQQEVDFSLRVAAADAPDVPQILLIHADQEVERVVVPLRELACGVALTGDPVLGQLAPRGRIDGIADLITARRRGVDLKFVGKSCLFDQVLHHKFRHRAAADIAQADK